MGQALRKVSENYNKYESYLRIVRSETTILAKNNYENNNNNHNYYDLKKNKIKSYLDDLRSHSAKTAKPEGVTMKTTKDRYTIQEAAEILGVSIRTLELREKEGRIIIIREKNKRRFITSEVIQAVLNGEVNEKHENEISENKNNEVCEPVDNLTIRENRIVEIIEPEKYSPQIQQPIPIIDVTRNIMAEVDDKIITALSEQQKFFTESINLLRQDNQELRYKIDQIETRQKEIDIENRTSRIEKYISEMRDRQRLPWWRKLFNHHNQ